MDGLTLCAWGAAHAMSLLFGTVAIVHARRDGSEKRLTSLYVSVIAMTPPLVSLVLIIALFVLGSSSNVAQLAGESGRDGWRLWLHAWPMLLFGCAISSVLSLVLVACPPYPPRGWASTVSRVNTLGVSVIGMIVVLRAFPDA